MYLNRNCRMPSLSSRSTMRSISVLSLIALLASPCSAVSWYFLRYYSPDSSSFTSLSGTLTVPSLPQAATYYLWPGLQPRDGSGVYQNVLDGRSGTWWLGSGWCCSNPSLPWGGGFNTYPGETVQFSNTLLGDTWTTTVTRDSSGDAVTDDFALADKEFNQVLFAIELYDVAWDFGSLEFSNVVIVREIRERSPGFLTNFVIRQRREQTQAGATTRPRTTTAQRHSQFLGLVQR